MSATLFPSAIVSFERDDETPIDEKLAVAARQLLASGPVSYDFSTRVHVPTLPRPKRLTVGVMRRIPEPFYVPPGLNNAETIFDFWADAVSACESPDDQILVRPRNRFFKRGEVSPAICCRPRDPADALRFRTLESVFGARACSPVISDVGPDLLIRETAVRVCELTRAYKDLEARLTALERMGGQNVAGRLTAGVK